MSDATQPGEQDEFRFNWIGRFGALAAHRPATKITPEEEPQALALGREELMARKRFRSNDLLLRWNAG